MLELMGQAFWANWLAFGAVLLLALLVAWWILRRRTTGRVRAATRGIRSFPYVVAVAASSLAAAGEDDPLVAPLRLLGTRLHLDRL